MTTTDAPASATRTPVVLVADKLDPAGVAILEECGIEARFQPVMTPEELLAAAADVDGILVRSAAKVTADVIDAAPRLKAVGRAGIGVDNIDLTAASRKGVLVMNTPLANATTTAEMAIAHMFGLARHTAEAQASMRAGRWDKSKLVGREVTGKTLAVIGLGKIGRIVAERGLGLRMNVIAYDPFLTGKSPLPGVELVDLDTALAQGDFITIHVPKSKDTLGLIDTDAFAKMKPDACLINCARGGVVSEADLVAALEAGQLAGAALDVFESEPLAEDSPLRNVPNLLLTPHLGASSSEAQQRVSTEIARQMADYLLRDEARCAVNAPSVAPEELALLRPWMTFARRGGLMLAQVADTPVVRVEIAYRGELSDMGTDPVRTEAVAGVLSPSMDGPVNAVNAAALAEERGLAVLEERHDSTGMASAATLELRATTQDGTQHTVTGTVQDGQPRLTAFDGYRVDFVPAGPLLLTRHNDEPGVLAQVATTLGDAGVNIGGLHMSARRNDTTSALALYELSRPLESAELASLEALAKIVAARTVEL
jgi:D-3-phosphoglycerate dehydrogenase